MALDIRNATLDSFRDHIASAGNPIAGGVAVSAVSGALAFSILAMTLEVSSRRKDFSGDRARAAALSREARNRGARMAEYAEDDTAAYQQYRDAVKAKQPMEAALRKIIDTPLGAADCAARGVELCVESLELVAPSVLPDLGAAATLLAASVKAILISVGANLNRLPAGSEWGEQARKTCRELEGRTGPPVDELLRKSNLQKRDQGDE